MMYGYNPTYGAMIAPEYMQKPCGMQKPMYGCGCGQTMLPQPVQPYPMPNPESGMQPMAFGNTVTPSYGTQMGAQMPTFPNGMTQVQPMPYPSYPTTIPSYPSHVNPTQSTPYPSYPSGIAPIQPMPYPGNQMPTQGCGQSMMPQPIPAYQSVTPQPVMYEEPLMTTTNYKKTTYMEAYVPVESDVPIMQNVVQTKPTKPVQAKPVLYSDNEADAYTIYSDNNFYVQDRGVPATPAPMKYNKLPLAQSYVQPQSYVNFNDPEVTLEQGTYFKDLYRPYMGGRLK